MIGYLQGRPLRFARDGFILLVQGVGYDLNCSAQTLMSLEGKTFVEVWVYTHVREDALQLFAFATELEKSMFLALLKVNGIGPKSALNVVSGAPTQKIVDWIEDSNVAALTGLPKVGKKSAEQIILSLQGKLVRAEDGSASARFKARAQIVSALVNLGFRASEVEKVVEHMPPETDLEQGLRQGLSALTT